MPSRGSPRVWRCGTSDPMDWASSRTPIRHKTRLAPFSWVRLSVEAGPQWQPTFVIRPQVTMNPGSTVTAQSGSENRLVLGEFLTDTNGAVWSTWWTMGHRASPPQKKCDSIYRYRRLNPCRACQPLSIMRLSVTHSFQRSGSSKIPGLTFPATSYNRNRSKVESPSLRGWAFLI